MGKTWKVIGKSNGKSVSFYEKGNEEFVVEPLAGDVVELVNKEYAIVYRRAGKLRFLAESEIERDGFDFDSYRCQ